MRRSAQLLVAMALVTGCGDEPAGTAEDRDLATLRTVTTPLQDFDRATAAGWSTEITPCMTDAAGGMGFHYGDATLIDGSVSLDKPEVLLYEPQAGGQMKLVGVEYIVPLSAWTAPNPPHLLGRDFHVIDAFQVWALHVWLWKDNPSGLYSDWNPQVSCQYAPAGSSMSPM